MKSKSSKEMAVDESQFELKYCERCGGLWLRRAGAEQVYCSRCEPEMAELPAVVRKREKSKKLKKTETNTAIRNGQYDGLDMDAMGGLL
jgi:Zn-finger nucleic acid-binding protein